MSQDGGHLVHFMAWAKLVFRRCSSMIMAWFCFCLDPSRAQRGFVWCRCSARFMFNRRTPCLPVPGELGQLFLFSLLTPQVPSLVSLFWNLQVATQLTGTCDLTVTSSYLRWGLSPFPLPSPLLFTPILINLYDNFYLNEYSVFLLMPLQVLFTVKHFNELQCFPSLLSVFLEIKIVPVFFFFF